MFIFVRESIFMEDLFSIFVIALTHTPAYKVVLFTLFAISRKQMAVSPFTRKTKNGGSK